MEMETSRLLLRPWREDDAENLYLYAKDPDVGPRAGWAPHKSVEDSLSIIRHVLSGEHDFAIVQKADGDVIGSISLFLSPVCHNEDNRKEMELGYWLAKPFWGKGLMSEAIVRMEAYGFESLGCSSLWCGYHGGNERSRKAQERNGFVFHHTEEKPVEVLGELRTLHYTFLSRESWSQRDR